MDNVGIQIPSPLFSALYQKYGDKTQSVIFDALNELTDGPDRLTSSNSIRPKPGTITARVWEIADQHYTDRGQALRNDVVQACIAEGINMNTANTQFSHWSKENQRRS